MNFVAVDFETAGYSRESAVSVGLAKYSGGQLVDSWHSLIRPPKLYIRPDFTDIHGLTVMDVQNAPFFDVVWEKAIRSFIGNLPLVAHNAAFDMSVLRVALDWYLLPIPPLEYFCTLKLASAAWPGLKSHALISLGEYFDIDYNAHNALADAKTCGIIVYKAAEKYTCAHLGKPLRVAELEMGAL
jgi:DNA polymerase-3 subunit epsilon